MEQGTVVLAGKVSLLILNVYRKECGVGASDVRYARCREPSVAATVAGCDRCCRSEALRDWVTDPAETGPNNQYFERCV
jgi:hypothetical protein